MYLSVIIPAFNEENRIGNTLLEAGRYLSGKDFDYEIIVVNDGSRDKTAELVKELKGKIANLKLIDNKENMGKGFAVRQGMMASEGECRIFIDADNSTLINCIDDVLVFFRKGYDIVIGSRKIQNAKIIVFQPFIRRALGRIFILLAAAIIGLDKIEDTQCGFKALTSGAAKDILPKCRINRWAFDPEILIIARKNGYKIKEVPVVWQDNKNSRIKFLAMLGMAIDLFKIKWNLIYNRVLLNSQSN